MSGMRIQKPNDYFGDFEPVDVLIWLDGPRTFTLLDKDGLLCFSHWLQEIDDQWQYVVVPISAQFLDELKNGERSLLDLLKQPRVYEVLVDAQFAVRGVFLTTLEQLPQDALPERGAMVSRELEPFFRFRAIGGTIHPGDIPGSVIKTTVENPQKTIRVLAEYELNHPSRQGKRSKALRQLYDLPAQRLQAASFEVSFRSPFSHGLFDDLPKEDKSVLGRVCEHLQMGIAWLVAGADENFFSEKS